MDRLWKRVGQHCKDSYNQMITEKSKWDRLLEHVKLTTGIENRKGQIFIIVWTIGFFVLLGIWAYQDYQSYSCSEPLSEEYPSTSGDLIARLIEKILCGVFG